MATVNHATFQVDIDWLSIISEQSALRLHVRCKAKVQMCGRRKLDKLFDTFVFHSFPISIHQVHLITL